MDVKYINPFLEGTMEVLRTMAGVELAPERPFLKKKAGALGDISGVIGLTGEVNGSLSVTFSFALVREAMRTMLGVVISGIDDQVEDAVGELTNMISGQARKGLAEEGLHLKAALPSVVTGTGHAICHISPRQVLVIPFNSSHGQVVVEVSLDS